MFYKSIGSSLNTKNEYFFFYFIGTYQQIVYLSKSRHLTGLGNDVWYFDG